MSLLTHLGAHIRPLLQAPTEDHSHTISLQTSLLRPPFCLNNLPISSLYTPLQIMNPLLPLFGLTSRFSPQIFSKDLLPSCPTYAPILALFHLFLPTIMLLSRHNPVLLHPTLIPPSPRLDAFLALRLLVIFKSPVPASAQYPLPHRRQNHMPVLSAVSSPRASTPHISIRRRPTPQISSATYVRISAPRFSAVVYPSKTSALACTP